MGGVKDFIKEEWGDCLVILIILAIGLFAYTHASKATECVLLVDEEYKWEFYSKDTITLVDFIEDERIARVELSKGCINKPDIHVTGAVYLCEGDRMIINNKVCRINSVVRLDD